MALEKIIIEQDRAWALWHLEEDEATLQDIVSREPIPDTITNPTKRLEWLGGRVLTKVLMSALGLPFRGITKDEHGKPFPTGHPHQLSLSHSYPYVGALIDAGSAGIDLEQPKEKLLRIAPRVLHASELADASNDIVKHCIYWCAKESLVKVHGKKDLTFAENLLIEPFERKHEGVITGNIIVKDSKQSIPLHYMVYPTFVVVLTKRINS